MNTKAPLISVVTVVLNDHAGLKFTGESILAQSCPAEWIVIDGRSTDATISVLNDFGEDVRWISEKDDGIYDAMNKGVRLCSGKYVIFLNAGDRFSSTEVLASVSDNLMDVDVLCCGANLVFADGRTVYRPPKNAAEYIWHGLPSNHQATFYRRALVGAEPYDTKFRLCSDYFLAATLYTSGARFGCLNKLVTEFFLDGVSYSWRKELFFEPFEVQKRVLSLGFGWRILSLSKRIISGVSLRLFSIPMFGEKIYKVFNRIRSKQSTSA